MKHLNDLKDDQTIHRAINQEGNRYGIRVLGRGENLFFQKNDRAFICTIDAVHAIIVSKSINKWDDGTKQRAMKRNGCLKK